MQDLNIDLGETLGGPETALASSPKTDAAKPEKHYPCLYINSADAKDLPDEGQMLITYRLRRVTKTKDDKGETTSMDLEVRSIDGVDGEVEEKKTPSDDFEARMKAHLNSTDEEEE